MKRGLGWLILLGLLIGCDQGRQLMVEGNQAYLRGDQERALSLYEKAAAHSDMQGSALLNWGRVLLDKGQFEQAIAKLDEGLARQPTNALGHYYRAQAHSSLNNSERALQDLKIALKANSTLGEAWLLQAQLQYAAGDHEAAFASLEQALRDPAVRQEASLSKAQWATATGDSKLARIALETLLAWHPYSEPGHRQLAKLLVDTGEFLAAEEHYRTLIRIGNQELVDRLALAELLLDRGKLPEAVGLYASVAGGSDPQLAAKAESILQELNKPTGQVVVNTKPLPAGERPVAQRLTQLVGAEQTRDKELEVDQMSCPSGWDGGFLMARMSMAFYVTSGTLTLESSAGIQEVKTGQSAYVPKGTPVGIRNQGQDTLQYLWVSVPSYRPELVIKLKRLP